MRQRAEPIKRHTYRGMPVDVSAQPGVYSVTTIVSVDGGILPSTQRTARSGSSGFEWGKEGDGEALAHALLAYEFGIDVADQHYEEYAQTIVAHLPTTGANGPVWTITSDDLRSWLNERSA